MFKRLTSAKDKSKVALLSRREREIAGYFGEDLTYANIAEELGLRADTVRVHARNIFSKLEVRSRHAAVAKLLCGGLEVTRKGN